MKRITFLNAKHWINNFVAIFHSRTISVEIVFISLFASCEMSYCVHCICCCYCHCLAAVVLLLALLFCSALNINKQRFVGCVLIYQDHVYL